MTRSRSSVNNAEHIQRPSATENNLQVARRNIHPSQRNISQNPLLRETISQNPANYGFLNVHPEALNIVVPRRLRGRPALKTYPWTYWLYPNAGSSTSKNSNIRKFEGWHENLFGYVPDFENKTTYQNLLLYILERCWDEEPKQTIQNRKIAIADHLLITGAIHIGHDLNYFLDLLDRMVNNLASRESVQKAPVIYKSMLDRLKDPTDFWTLLLWMQSGLRFTSFTNMTRCNIRIFDKLMLLFPTSGKKNEVYQGGTDFIPIFCNCCHQHGSRYCCVHNIPHKLPFPIARNRALQMLHVIGIKGHSPRRTLAISLLHAVYQDVITREHANEWMLWSRTSNMIYHYTLDGEVTSSMGTSIPLTFIWMAAKYKDILKDDNVARGLVKILDSNPELEKIFNEARDLKLDQPNHRLITQAIEDDVAERARPATVL